MTPYQSRWFPSREAPRFIPTRRQDTQRLALSKYLAADGRGLTPGERFGPGLVYGNLGFSRETRLEGAMLGGHLLKLELTGNASGGAATCLPPPLHGLLRSVLGGWLRIWRNCPTSSQA